MKSQIGQLNVSARSLAARRVTWVGFFFNVVLTALKFFAGVIGHSGAMIADAVHSLSDFVTDIVVLIGVKFAGKPADKGHAYGHGKYETLATAFVGVALLVVGADIFWSSAVKVWRFYQGEHLAAPGGIALIVAVVSISAKEWLYRYSAAVGKRIESQPVLANAWHHRSDALSSVGTMIGIGGAIALGGKWHVLDPLAAAIMSVFIVKIAVGILFGSVRELTEESLGDNIKEQIIELVSAFDGVSHPHKLRTRRIGSDIAVDLHIRVAGNMRVDDAHDITSGIESEIRRRFGQSTFVSIHIEPHL